MHDRHGVGALGLGERMPNRVGEVAGVGLLDQVREGLRVGLGAQLVSALRQPIAQLLEVLDDAVVDDRDVAGAVDVWMGIQVVRAAVGRPAGVSEADGRRGRRIQERRAKVAQLAGSLLDEQVALSRDQRDARGVVAAVLEAGEAFEEDGRGLTRPDVADDPTHARSGALPAVRGPSV